LTEFASVSNRTIALDDRLYAYLLANSLREPEVLRRLRAETLTMARASMQIAPEQGQFMALLVRLMGATRIVEIGTFTGYSTLAMALALPAHGRVIACDVSDEWTAIARRYWAEAGVADRIDLRLQPALDTLDRLIADGEAGRFDIAFIDADKENGLNYYERALTLLRPGGIVLIDNTLWNGSVADPARDDGETAAIRALNAALHGDERIDLSLLPLGDGLTIARKRGNG
jgi:caffeoyl-CoA O-methyltransferase